jgi:hypothetical protein
MSNIIVWDTETVPDLKGFAAANGHVGKTDDEVRAGGPTPRRRLSMGSWSRRHDGVEEN